MRTSCKNSLPALLILLLGCSKPEAAQPAADLTGTWAGTTAIAQAGNCTWGSAATLPTSATWQVANNEVKATIIRKDGSIEVPVTMVGTLIGTRIRLLSQGQNATCNGVARQYSVWYEGEVSGKELTLVGLDTICPVQKCIFRRTVSLTRQ